jgi:hypothetical protein
MAVCMSVAGQLACRDREADLLNVSARRSRQAVTRRGLFRRVREIPHRADSEVVRRQHRTEAARIYLILETSAMNAATWRSISSDGKS